jgi:Big-like domain-containing protein
MSGQRIATVVVVLSCSLGAGSTAWAKPGRVLRPTAAELGLVPRTVYVQVPQRERPAGRAMADRGGPTVLFLNRGGGQYQGSWWDDSTTNQSSILNFTVDMPAYPYGDRSWNQLLGCMRDAYSPFNVEVTDVDPGDAPHVEVVVSGHPTDIGQQDGVGGIAPMACDVIDNAVAYAFPETYGDDPSGICEAAAQESAHAFGLDHEMQCDDFMTYLWCGTKSFRDVDAPCGEFRERTCSCGGSTQNSYQYLMSVLGPADEVPPDEEPPTVSITSPADGAEVDSTFRIDVDAADNVALSIVELYVDGDRTASLGVPPWRFVAPPDLGSGDHEIEVRATDTSNLTASDHITVTLPGGTDPGQGEDPQGQTSLGRLGDDCDGPAMCDSNACVASDGYCTERCTDSCADGFTCTDTPEGQYCLRSAKKDERSRGCAVGGPLTPGDGIPILVGLTLLGLVHRRRGSRRTRPSAQRP